MSYETLQATIPPPAGLTGQTLDGRYVIERELAHGGVGAVYLARDRKLHDKLVVVKVLLDQSLRDEWVLLKFQQEKEALSRVDHPGVVGILDTGELPDRNPYIVMQFIDGVSLRAALTPHGMDLARAAAIVKQIGAALGAVHEKGIYHRDLKPENIMLQRLGDGEEQVKIVDFGIAKVKQSDVAQSTATGGASAGTMSYMAPEQLRGEKVTAASDVYALGIIAYEMVTGRRPFNPETPFQLLELQRAGVQVKPIDLRPRLSVEAQIAMLRALSLNPADRYQSARLFGDSLAQALLNEGETIKPLPNEQPELPATLLANEETPLAGKPVATIVATFDQAHPIARSHGAQHNPIARKRWPMLVAIPIVVAVLVTGVYFTGRRFWSRSQDKTITSNPIASRSLVYSLTVQKYRDGRPYEQPFETSGQEIFENGWKFKLNIYSPQEGYLYLVNEGPGANGATTYNMLFPDPKTNGGSARVAADNKLQTGLMNFDEHQGIERFWIVWSSSPVKELDAVTGVVNLQQKGEISDADEAKAVRDFLDKHSSPKRKVTKDSAAERTTVEATGDVLVSNVELKHH